MHPDGRKNQMHPDGRKSYAERRRMLLIELRLMRLTKPARRVVKHQQRLMRALRVARRMGVV